MRWLLVEFDDGMLSHILKGEKVEMQSGNSAQDEASVVVGDRCRAPWQGQLYDGTVTAVSGKLVLKVASDKNFSLLSSSNP